MNHQSVDLPAGLYLVATPIGNARDITLRALDVLGSADILAAEDTRTLQRLMQIHGISRASRPLLAYHDHAGPAVVARIVAEVKAGRSVAYCSEAGMPLISDPGYGLVQALVAERLSVTVAPGASAAVTAVALAGLPSDRFAFLGFPPARGGARARWLAAEAERKEPSVIYESPRRIGDLLAEMAESWGAQRMAALCRELTKLHEDVRRGTLAELGRGVETDPPRGECVLVVAGAPEREITQDTLRAALLHALESNSVKTATAEVARMLGLPRKEVYRMALELRSAGDDA